MKTIRNPENRYVPAFIVFAITSYVNEVGTQLNEAAAEHLTTWLLTRDWGAVVEWCLLHATALQQL